MKNFLNSHKLIIPTSKIINEKCIKEYYTFENENDILKYSIYLGVDPTNSALHLGNLSQLILLKKLSKYFNPIVIIGNGTAKIGDPSGKKKERPLLSNELIAKNTLEISKIIKKYFPNFKILYNFDWLSKISFLDFLTQYGKYITLTNINNLESVKSRAVNTISFTEASYTLIQAIDFLHLCKNYNCVAQIGGSDQYGNIVMGIKLINNLLKKDKKLFGLTSQLLLDNKGNKLGKSTNNAFLFNLSNTKLKLNNALFHFCLNINDNDIEKYFLYLTMHQKSNFVAKNDHKFYQKKLCELVISFFYSKKEFEEVFFLTNEFFYKKYLEINFNVLKLTEKYFDNSLIENNNKIGIYSKKVLLSKFENENIISFFTQINFCDSKKRVWNLLKNNAIKFNDMTLELIDKEFIFKDLIVKKNIKILNNLIIFKKGKKTILLIKLI